MSSDDDDAPVEVSFKQSKVDILRQIKEEQLSKPKKHKKRGRKQTEEEKDELHKDSEELPELPQSILDALPQSLHSVATPLNVTKFDEEPPKKKRKLLPYKNPYKISEEVAKFMNRTLVNGVPRTSMTRMRRASRTMKK